VVVHRAATVFVGWLDRGRSAERNPQMSGGYNASAANPQYGYTIEQVSGAPMRVVSGCGRYAEDRGRLGNGNGGASWIV